MRDFAVPTDGSLHRPGPLDVGDEEGARLLAAASRLLVGHARTVADGPVAPPEPAGGRIRERLAAYDFRAARPAAEVLSDVMALLRAWTVHTTHPRYFGLFNPTPTWWGVAGELLAAGINPQLAVHSHAPAAVELERHVLRFLAARLGMPATAEGSFTVGGAEANLTAVVVALTRRFPSYPETGLVGLPGRPVFYASAESHLAWLKIAHLAGLGRNAVRLVPVDGSHRMDVGRLRRAHDADVAAGDLPFLVVGTAGTTGGGALDPLPDLAAAATEWGLHFHVDAAWGGAVALSDRLRPLLDGVQAADSVTVDAHKWLSAPMGAGVFLTPHVQALADSFRVVTAYMPAGAEGAADPYTTSVQWSRRHMGLKVFVALAAAGRPAFAEQLERDVDLGALLARRLDEHGWQRVNDTPLPVVCVVDPGADATGPGSSRAWHTGVAERVVGGGLAWVSPVLLDGRAAVRLCVTSHRTTARDIDVVVSAMNAAREAMASDADGPRR